MEHTELFRQALPRFVPADRRRARFSPARRRAPVRLPCRPDSDCPSGVRKAPYCRSACLSRIHKPQDRAERSCPHGARLFFKQAALTRIMVFLSRMVIFPPAPQQKTAHPRQQGCRRAGRQAGQQGGNASRIVLLPDEHRLVCAGFLIPGRIVPVVADPSAHDVPVQRHVGRECQLRWFGLLRRFGLRWFGLLRRRGLYRVFIRNRLKGSPLAPRRLTPEPPIRTQPPAATGTLPPSLPLFSGFLPAWDPPFR